MKKHLIGALIVLSTLTACTDNDTENTNPGESTFSLNKTITYFPALENFETRNVKYYDNNIIVADSTYDNSGNFISRKIHTFPNSSSYVIENKDAADVTIGTETFTYDEQGRLVELNGLNGRYHYTYNGDAISVEYWDPSDVFIEVGMFTLNSDGYIEIQTVLSNDIITESTSLVFSNINKPTSLMAQGTTGTLEQLGTFSYYPNSMPTNLQKSITEVNNEVLKANTLKAAAMYGNYHLQDIMVGNDTYYHSDTVFWPVSGYEGYPQYQTITIEGQPYCYIRYYFSN